MRSNSVSVYRLFIPRHPSEQELAPRHRRQAGALVPRSGERKTLDLQPAQYSSPRFSPDGRHIAFTLFGARETNIWVYDVTARTAPRRLTFAGDGFDPVWTPDGKRIVFGGDEGLWWQPADGSGSAERLIAAEAGRGMLPMSFPRHSNILSYLRTPALWTIALDGDRTPKSLVRPQSGTVGVSRFSPDGRWVAYTFNETSRDEIFVEPVPPTPTRRCRST